MERRREFGCLLLAAHVDLRKALDSVHRGWLRGILALPTRIVGLIASLFPGTESAIKCGGD